MILSSVLDQIRYEVDSILRKEFGTQLFQMKADDAIRLLRLRVWSTRYKVSVCYILKRLIPHFKKYASNFRRRYNDKGIGVTIAVLTGKVAEQKLKEFIARDFESGENAIEWREKEQARCLDLLHTNELVGRPKPFLHYKSVKSFIQSYEKRIAIMNREDNKLIKKLAKQPWRNNPFR